MTLFRSLILVAVAGLMCLLTAGCELASVDGSIDGQTFEGATDETAQTDTTNPADTADTTDPSTPADPVTSVTNQPGFGGNYVAGNTADKGDEIYRQNWNGGDVRCLGADYNDDGYFMSDVIDQTGALTLGSDGVATARNFISPRTGLHYRFEGFRERTSTSRLITENPHRVVNRGTFRCYWNPVEGL